MNVPMFQFWRSTTVPGDQVIFYIFCIFYIFFIFCIFLISVWLLHSLVGCVPVHHWIQVPWIFTSLVRDSCVLHIGAAASCSSRHWQYRDDTVRDAKRISNLWRRFLRQNEERQGLLQVVVREQLGPQLWYKAIIDQGICKGSVAHLIRHQTFCAGGSGSNPVGPSRWCTQ